MRPVGRAQEIAATGHTRGTQAGAAGATHDEPARPHDATSRPRRFVRWAASGLGGLLGPGFVLAGVGFF
jgi:hypothetical protein